jgi:RNA-splicing ligase RtcB
VLTHNLDQTLERSLGRQIHLRLVYDAPHVVLSREKHNGKTVWVHRNGATRALAGEPGLLAPFEQTFGYIGVGTDKSATTFASANHELGKLDNTPAETFKALPKVAQGKFAPVNVYTKKETETVNPNTVHATFGQTIAEEIEQNAILSLVVKLKTVASLTHHS